MRAAAITTYNSDWELKTLPDPRPAAGQVLIKIHASGMCGTDLHVHHGVFGLPLPIIAGHEPVGEVVELGPGVVDFKVGDRVGVQWNQKGCGRCDTCRAGDQAHCAQAQSWMNIGGGNSELMLAWASGCTLLPEGLDYQLAAPIFCAGYTVMSGLRNADPKPGERVAVLGLGGLGHLALQFSHALGLETWAITGQANKVAELKALGASEVLVVRDDPNKAMTDAGGFDIVLSTTNSAKQVSSAFGGLRRNGRLISMGLTTDGPIAIDSAAALMGQRQLRGSSQDERSDLVEALALVAAGKAKPVLETYPMTKVNEVRERLAQGKIRYRAVLLHTY
ncbi:MAG: alcohol dehydrogenase catalytic domain-containing protein [Polyangiaceae bacterium]|nr:alcohol dehydrogenase catalytic domain-containing protein [Polyangiaceae bacterium]